MSEEEKKAIKWLKELYDIEKDFNSSKGKEESNIIKTLLNLIEKQQKEIEELKEDNKSYKYILDMQNKREYRSKFLKDFQKENGKNMLPDYDEIYKRYDKQKEEIKELKEEIDQMNKNKWEDWLEENE